MLAAGKMGIAPLEIPVPTCRGQVQKLDATIHQRGVLSPTLPHAGPDRVLDFSTELDLYKKRILARRTAEHLQITQSLLAALSFRQDTALICSILCHVSEDTDRYHLESLIKSVARSGGHTVIFMNGVDGAMAAQLLDDATQALKHRFDLGGLGADVSVVCSLFKRREPLSAIRGILADAIALAAQRSGMTDPVITSNDVDVMAVPDNYAKIIVDTFKSPHVDVLSGPVFYGYDYWGMNRTGLSLRAPELMLANRAVYSRKLAYTSGVILGSPYLPTDGPNIAYRLSAYCAAGGYDFQVDLGEDVYIGAALFALRSEAGHPFPNSRHAVYNFALWVTTDPRRQLSSICSGFTLEECWSFVPFSESLGSAMKTPQLAEMYGLNPQLIQSDDLADLQPSRISDKLRRRAMGVYLESLRADKFDDDIMTFMAGHYGLLGISRDWSADNAQYSLSDEITSALKLCHASG
jgi:hypothetical protein